MRKKLDNTEELIKEIETWENPSEIYGGRKSWKEVIEIIKNNPDSIYSSYDKCPFCGSERILLRFNIVNDKGTNLKNLFICRNCKRQDLDDTYNLEELVSIIRLYFKLKAKSELKESEIEQFTKCEDIIIKYINNKCYRSIYLTLGRLPRNEEKISHAADIYITPFVEDFGEKEMSYFIRKRLESGRNMGLRITPIDEFSSKKEYIDNFFLECVVSLISKKHSQFYWKVRTELAPKNSPIILERIKEIEDELEKKIEEALKKELGEEDYNDLKGKLGFCHRYWAGKKRILREEYGINWYTPTECNPGVMFD